MSVEAPRYFLAQDGDCHWYLVRADRRGDWEAWSNLDSDDEASWEAPDYAEAIGGDPSMITFSDPKRV